jgi:hypothetical protein
MARPLENINHITVAEIPNSQQQRFEYNTDMTVKYAGYAAKGVSAAADFWTIHKFTYSGGACTVRQTAFGSWDGRDGLTYE